jgi:hypothetical protein
VPNPIVSFHFTDAQWEAIRSVRKSWPDFIDWAKVRDEIERLGREAVQLRHNRSYLGPPLKIRNSLRRVLRLRRELQAAMNALPEPIRGSSPDPDLEEQERRLQSWLDRYELLAGPAFRGHKDPIRFWVEVRLLVLWMGELEGDLSFSRKLDGTPSGPLVEFLTLTLQAIMTTAPGPDGIAKIIDQHRKTLSLPD